MTMYLMNTFQSTSKEAWYQHLFNHLRLEMIGLPRLVNEPLLCSVPPCTGCDHERLQACQHCWDVQQLPGRRRCQLSQLQYFTQWLLGKQMSDDWTLILWVFLAIGEGLGSFKVNVQHQKCQVQANIVWDILLEDLLWWETLSQNQEVSTRVELPVEFPALYMELFTKL